MEKINYHISIASYFSAQPLFFDGDLQKKPHIRKCAELPYQQTNAELWNEVTDTLCNLDFIQAKAVAKMTYDLVKDFNDVLEIIPDNSDNIMQEKARQARMEKYTNDLIACAKGEIKVEELEVPESITPWPQEKINAEIERIKTNPTRLDRIREFLNFLGIESNNLQKYAGEILYFAIQQAWNYADDGIVSKTAEQTDSAVLMKLLQLKNIYRPVWNPFPQAQKKITGHSGSVNAVSMTPDGRHALTGSGDTTCIFWDLVIGQALKILKGHSGSVNSVSMTPDGKYAFTGSIDKTCIFWDIETGQALKSFKGHSEYITSVDLTPDAKYAVSGSKDDTCIIWDIESGHQLRTLRFYCGVPFYDGVAAVCISPSGKFVISCTLDFPYYLILWDRETGKLLKKFADCKKNITVVHSTPDGKYAISSCSDKTIVFYDLETGLLLIRLQGHKDSVNSISLTPDKKLALSASSDKTCILWDLETNQSVKTLEGHSWGVHSVDITPDGKYALTGSGDETCIFWDLEIGNRNEMPTGHTDNFTILRVSVDGRRAVSGSVDRTCILWDLETGKVLNSLTGFDGETNVVLTHDGKKAITFDRYALTFEWELENGSNFQIPTGRRFGTDSICISPNGKHIISTSDDGTFILRDLTTGKALRILKGHTLIWDTVSITPEGKYAISASHDNTCTLWDLDNGELLNSFKGHTDIFPKFNIMFTPDGKCAISGSIYDIYMLWSLDNCKLLKTLGERSDKIESIIITPEGKRALSYANQGICVLWDLKTGLALKTYGGNNFKEIKSINVTPDGENVVSISYNDSCIIWNLKSGKILQRYVGHFSFETLALYSKGIVIGETTGKIITLNPNREIFCPGPGITTIRHLWDFDNHQFISSSADCPLCGLRFAPEVSVLTTIEEITKKAGLRSDQSPCLELPDEAWEDPGLLGNCPKCGGELKFNPFIAGGDY